MFFYIGDKTPFNNLKQVDELLFIDEGWDTASINDIKVWYKGYSTECTISDNLEKIYNGYKPAGKWCMITQLNQEYDIFHGPLRGFPIYKSGDQRASFWLEGFEIEVYEHDYTNLVGELTLNEAVDQITDILQNNVINFYRYNKIPRINVLYSAGLDTLTSWVVLDSITKDYTLEIKPGPLNLIGKREYESDLFPFLNSHWGYRISNYYKNKNWYLTGFYGERIHFREVDNSHVVANHLGTTVKDSLTEDDYLYWFMQRPECELNPYPTLKTEHEVKMWCYGKIFYDYQMWHLDNNFHFSPMCDINISKVMLKLSISDIATNQKNGTIQQKIVEKLNPDMLSILAPYKNSKNVWENYAKNFPNLKHRFKDNLMRP